MTKAMKICLLAIACMGLFIGGCADRWSRTGANGATYETVEPICRSEARASAKTQLPDKYDRDYGPSGFPITRRDIENRETSRCLLDKGFSLL